MRISRLFATLGLVLLSFVLAVGCHRSNLSNAPSDTTQPTALTISAAASLRDTLTEIQSLYRQEQPSVTLTYNFGSSGSLQQQIEQGAPVDVFISAAPKQMDALQDKDLLLNDTRRNLLINQIALVTAQSATLSDFKDLQTADVEKIAIGDPASVPAGKYSEETLNATGILEQVKSKLVLAKDVRQVLSYVETENVDAGLVYVTDAQISDKVKVVAIAPEGFHTPIVYPVAVVKASQQPEAAKTFVDFLTSDTASAVFQQYGFGLAAK